MEDLFRVFQGTYHNGNLGFGGDLKHAGAEVVKLSIQAGVALGEHADGNLILLDHLNAFEDGFQSLPVVFPVDHLAHELVHQVADDEHFRVLPLGNKGQLGLGEAAQQQNRVQNIQVVAHHQESALRRHQLLPLQIDLHTQNGEDGRNIELCQPAVEFAVLCLGNLLLYHCRHCPQEQKGQGKQPHTASHKDSHCRRNAHSAQQGPQNRRHRGKNRD